MTPSFLRRCSRCGTSVPSDLHSCQQCGLPMEVNAGASTVISGEKSSSQMKPSPLDPYSAPPQIAFPPDYLRLQVGDNQIAEANDNMSTEFAAGTTASKGLVAFLFPQENTGFSLVLLGNGTAHASNQATIPFTIA